MGVREVLMPAPTVKPVLALVVIVIVDQEARARATAGAAGGRGPQVRRRRARAHPRRVVARARGNWALSFPSRQLCFAAQRAAARGGSDKKGARRRGKTANESDRLRPLPRAALWYVGTRRNENRRLRRRPSLRSPLRRGEAGDVASQRGCFRRPFGFASSVGGPRSRLWHLTRTRLTALPKNKKSRDGSL